MDAAEAETRAVLQGLREELEEVQSCAKSYLDDGLLAKYQEAQAMATELEDVVGKLEAMLPPSKGDDDEGKKKKKKKLKKERLQEPATTPELADDVPEAPPSAEAEADSRGVSAEGGPGAAAAAAVRQAAIPVHSAVLLSVGGVLEIAVQLPDVESAAELSVEVLEDGRSVEVETDGGMRMVLSLPGPAAPDACQVKFSKKNRRLRVLLEGDWGEAPAGPIGLPVETGAGGIQGVVGVRGVGAGEGLSGDLFSRGFAVADDFLAPADARALVDEVTGMAADGRLAEGEVESGHKVRGDWLAWVEPSKGGGAGIKALARELDRLVMAITPGVPSLAAAGSLMRDRAMVTHYPPSDVGYEKHVDNDNKPHHWPRLLTCIVYLNFDWAPRDGGQLRIYSPEGGAGAGAGAAGAGAQQRPPVDVAPLGNRLVLFWSDSRCPHEVMPAKADRYAVSFWYYDGDLLSVQEKRLDKQLAEGRSAAWGGMVDHYRAAVRANPSEPSNHQKLVDAAIKVGEIDMAVEVAVAFTEAHAGSAESHYTLGVALQERVAAEGAQGGKHPGDLEDAAAAYERALEREPEHRHAIPNLLVVLEHLGRLERLRELATLAVGLGGVVEYDDPWQRPTVFVQGLRASAWWDPRELPSAGLLEANYAAIKEEVLALLAKRARRAEEEGVIRFSSNQAPVDPGWRRTVAGTEGWRKIVKAGKWNELVLWGAGGRVDENCSQLPRTSAVVDAIREATGLATVRGGEVLISVLAPGTHLRAHCGPSNNRLTVHLGLVVPEGLRIRVGEEVRGWEEGRCIAFDDSFEHEVWHEGGEARVVLLMNVWHPDITEDQKRESVDRLAEGSAQRNLARAVHGG